MGHEGGKKSFKNNKSHHQKAGEPDQPAVAEAPFGQGRAHGQEGLDQEVIPGGFRRSHTDGEKGDDQEGHGLSQGRDELNE